MYFQTPVEKEKKKKSVFSVRDAGFLIETKSRLKTRRVTFPNLLHK
jgi:hypothetical protein